MDWGRKMGRASHDEAMRMRIGRCADRYSTIADHLLGFGIWFLGAALVIVVLWIFRPMLPEDTSTITIFVILAALFLSAAKISRNAAEKNWDIWAKFWR
jgi:hypothetical protein